MAFVEIKGSPCGGFLVRKDFVLTAAHCLPKGQSGPQRKGNNTRVILGAHDLSMTEKNRQEIAVQDIIPHENYNRRTKENDIMLLQLARKAKITKTVDLIRLPQANNVLKPGPTCSVAGWGRTGVHIIRPSNKLQEVDLKMGDVEQCRRLYSSFNSTLMICMGDSRDKKSSFKGDSGGPLVCKGIAQGIVSFGKHSGIPPAVYTRVSAYIDWIEENMGQE
ncbi:mast cell protease 3-like [Alligator sinensis]|uniref:Mast cell protease 3-like n=1 Tax=Alligator sinensis TaxID=38654 RepID=A0A1U7SVQ3_ALLSI|nr:mast cell protease 3-like [Alligator sinensis]